MTDAEALQLRNELDFLKRKVAAMDKKYAPLKGKSFLAIVCSTEKAATRRRSRSYTRSRLTRPLDSSLNKVVGKRPLN